MDFAARLMMGGAFGYLVGNTMGMNLEAALVIFVFACGAGLLGLFK